MENTLLWAFGRKWNFDREQFGAALEVDGDLERITCGLSPWINILPTPISCFWTAQNDEPTYVQDQEVQSETFTDRIKPCNSHAMMS